MRVLWLVTCVNSFGICIWEYIQGIYDAIIVFANQLSKNSEYFKRALHLVKSSTNEPDEAQHVITLNKNLDLFHSDNT